MTKEEIKSVLERVLAWPPAAQAEAVASLEMIEEELAGTQELSADDKLALERSDDDVRHGRFAAEEDVQEAFSRFRRQ